MEPEERNWVIKKWTEEKLIIQVDESKGAMIPLCWGILFFIALSLSINDQITKNAPISGVLFIWGLPIACMFGAFFYYWKRIIKVTINQAHGMLTIKKITFSIKKPKIFALSEDIVLISNIDVETKNNLHNLAFVLETNQKVPLYSGSKENCQQLGKIIKNFLCIPLRTGQYFREQRTGRFVGYGFSIYYILGFGLFLIQFYWFTIVCIFVVIILLLIFYYSIRRFNRAYERENENSRQRSQILPPEEEIISEEELNAEMQPTSNENYSEIIQNQIFQEEFTLPFTCIVCKLPLNPDDEFLFCPNCHLIAHSSHLLEWIKIKGCCPNCRFPLKQRDFFKKLIKSPIY